jgi:hypothetical protein
LSALREQNYKDIWTINLRWQIQVTCTSLMKEPLVSKLTIPYASPLYHTGNNILATTYSWNITQSPS